MDYARRIGKQKSEIWNAGTKNHDRIPSKPCSQRKFEKPLEEDHRLVNWKRWIADREDRQNRLTAALKRKPLDLAINAHEKVRSQNEKKIILDAARKTEVTNQDKYRGNPAFWKVPERLKNKCKNNDDVVVGKNKEAKFLPPDVTRIGLSDHIKKEKLLVESFLDASSINLETKWDCADYLKKRTAELNREIKFLEPKKPEIENLVIIGQKLEQCEPKLFVRTPIITITSEETKRKPLSDPENRIALKIQDREFALERTNHFEKLSIEETQKLRETKEDLNEKKYVYAIFENDCIYKILSKKSKPLTWTLNFQTKDKEICERKFIFENKGVYVMNIDWRDETPKSSCIPTPERVKSNFFFDKNRLRILPGQKVEFPIWFRSECPIIATETWKLIIHPQVYPGIIHLRLWATSSGQNQKLRFEKHFDDVKLYLERRVRDSTIREIFDELLITSTSDRYIDNIPYDMYFLEREIYEARNPGFNYDSLLIGELKCMYKVITDKEWNLSMKDLRSILLQTKNPNIIRFREICDESLHPRNIYSHPISSKEKLIYWLLCSFFNQFEDESYFVMSKCCSGDIEENLEEDEEFEDESCVSEIQITKGNLQVYQEVFHIRIHCLLEETIDRISTAVECHNYFRQREF